MHILHIIDTISPQAGGPSEAVRMIVHYQPAGYTSEVVTLDDPSAPFLAQCPFTITALGSAKKSWYSSKLNAWLRANRDRFDGVMVHGLWGSIGLAALRAFKGRKPYVVFPHGMLDPYFKRAFPAKHLKKWLYWLLVEYWVLRFAHRVLFTTATERDLARQSFWLSRWEPLVVALGSEAPLCDPALAIPSFFAHLPAVKDRRFLLFLGRLHPKKGCDMLLEAFAAEAARDPELHLVMAGPGPADLVGDLQAIAELRGIAARVHWPGMLEGEVKSGAFAACEAFILPSHQENFGIAVVEALTYSRPVLLSEPINIAPDLAADGSALVEPDTLDGTRRLLQRWIALSPQQRSLMASRAHESFATRYDMGRNTESILRSFESTSASHPGPPRPGKLTSPSNSTPAGDRI